MPSIVAFSSTVCTSVTGSAGLLSVLEATNTRVIRSGNNKASILVHEKKKSIFVIISCSKRIGCRHDTTSNVYLINIAVLESYKLLIGS